MRFTDPDGMGPNDIVLIGTPEYQQRVLSDLQKLSNDKLVMNGNKVEIEASGTMNSSKSLSVGTSLISELICSDKKTTIESSVGGNKTTPDFGLDAEMTSKGPGLGTGSEIKYNPNSKGEDIVNADGTTGRPAEIGLGHELGHAKNNKDGTRDTHLDTEKTDPDTGEKGVLTKEEINVRQIDSQIREEQGVVPRKQPY